MRYIADADTARDIDNIAINELGVPSVVLMERAADAAARIICSENPQSVRILAVCGKGNNGGDAIACARILDSAGYEADIYMLSDRRRMTYEAGIQYDIAVSCGMSIYSNGIDEFHPEDYDVIIDGIFGVGLSKPVSGIYSEIIDTINCSDTYVYSMDVPSGVNASDGAVLGVAVNADVTVTFGQNKIGLIMYPGYSYAGRVIIADGVFPSVAYRKAKNDVYIYEPDDIWMLPERHAVSNKGTYGHVLVIAGSKGMSGAAYLSAKAAYRTGCGLVKIITHEDNRIILQTQLPEAIISTYGSISDIEEQWFEDCLSWADSIVIGPGIGLSKHAEALVKRVIRLTDIPVIIDADAINIISGLNIYKSDSALFDNAILTPHLKEMSRLTGNEILPEFIHGHIIDIAGRYTFNDEVLVLKDVRTVVSHKSSIYINSSGNDGMAVAGSGDVLTGIIASLVAQGLDRQKAAELGVYIHGLAGDKAAKKNGRYSMTSVDILDGICEVLPKI